jgi:23S rRNA G2445 N2-methylase RlmL
MGFVLGQAGADLAEVITSPLSQGLFQTFTKGAIRYRLNFAGKGHQRAAVAQLARQIYTRLPEIINDGQDVTWTVDIYPDVVELRPNMTPDPRFSYRQKDVPAASHPTLAAALARVAGRIEHDVIWDPFCGSGLELIESARLGPAPTVFGSDLSPEAVRIAQNNFAAANIKSLSARFFHGDFRDAAKTHAPGTVTLIITNPPMGRRVPVNDLQRLLLDFFAVAANALRPGGRLVLVNPLSIENPHPRLRLQLRHKVDLGGFAGHVEKYVHV